MKISRGVSYRMCDDKIIVCNFNTRKEYRFDNSIGQILNYVAENPTHSVPTLLKFFAAQFDNDNVCDAYDKAQREIGAVVDELLGEEILTEVDESTTANQS